MLTIGSDHLIAIDCYVVYLKFVAVWKYQYLIDVFTVLHNKTKCTNNTVLEFMKIKYCFTDSFTIKICLSSASQYLNF